MAAVEVPHCAAKWPALPNPSMLNRGFKEFAALLDAKGVDYLVVGGYALAAHDHATHGNMAP